MRVPHAYSESLQALLDSLLGLTNHPIPHGAVSIASPASAGVMGPIKMLRCMSTTCLRRRLTSSRRRQRAEDLESCGVWDPDSSSFAYARRVHDMVWFLSVAARCKPTLPKGHVYLTQRPAPEISQSSGQKVNDVDKSKVGRQTACRPLKTIKCFRCHRHRSLPDSSTKSVDALCVSRSQTCQSSSSSYSC